MKGLFDLLLPSRCASCGLPGEILCESCRAGLTPIRGPICERCGHPWALSVPRCGECGPIPQASRQALAWEGPTLDLVRDLKDRGIRAAADPCAEAIIAHTPVVASPLVPVPPSAAGRRDRGFDQALVIARICAAAWGVDVLPVLARTGRERQRGAPRGRRRAMSRGAFRARRAGSPREVVLVDDVVTTGSTLAAGAAALRTEGWRVVGTRAVARVMAGPSPG